MSQFCTKCGAENRDEARFCHACGNVLETPIGEQSVPTHQESKVATSEPILTEKEATFKEFFFSTKGRVGRKEYFFRWFMPYLSSLIVLTILSNVLQMQQVDSGIVLFANFAILLLIAAFLVAQILVGIKRLHDINASGWWSLLWLVPLANFVLLLVLFFKGTSSEASQRSGMKTGCYTQTPMRWGLFSMQLILTIVLVPFLMLTNLLVKAEEKDQVNSIPEISSEEYRDVINKKVVVQKQDILIPCSFATLEGKKEGFINQEGSWVIPPIYDTVEDFSEGLAVVKIFGKYGFIDQKGSLIIQPIYESASSFKEGLAKVGIDHQKVGFVDKKGNWSVQPVYNDLSQDFSEGVALVSVENKTGFIDRNGNWTIQPIFELKISNGFKEGLAAVKMGGKTGFIDHKGNWVIKPIYDDASDFSDGLSKVMVDGKYGFIDKTGNLVFKLDFEPYVISNFREGLSGFALNGKIGAIDKMGRVVIQPVYDFPVFIRFKDGISRVKVGGKMGYIDRRGNWIKLPIYVYASSEFKNGLAVVSEDEVHYNLINKKGEIVAKVKSYQ